MAEIENNEIELSSTKEQSNCLSPEVGDLVFDYILGETPTDRAREIEEHVVLCSECREAVMHMKSMIRVVRANPRKFFELKTKQANKIVRPKALKAGGGSFDT